MAALRDLNVAGAFARAAVATALLAGALASQAAAQPIQGAGSTFAAPLIVRWSESYAAARTDGGEFTSPDWKVDYEPVGSLAGIMRLDQPDADFAATDVPVTPDVLASQGRQQFPIVTGGIAVAANLQGVSAGALKLSGPVLADIYLGTITSWSDARIKSLNPDLALPDAAIAVLHRQDGSGSTFAFTQFLAGASPQWAERLGADTLIDWPVGRGVEGTSDLVAAAAATPGAIAYADYGQVSRATLPFAAIENRAGRFVTPEPAGVEAATAGMDGSGAGFAADLSAAPGEAAYPISIATYAVVAIKGRPPERWRRVHDLFRLGLTSGAADAQELGYVPLPPVLVEKIEASWASPLATR